MRRTNQTNQAGWPLLGGLLILAVGAMLLLSWLGNTAQAQGSGYALRFYGHGTGDIDRVKIKIDNPPVPADVGGNFTIEFWMKANDADNQNSPSGCGQYFWIYGNIILDRDINGSPSSGGDFGVSMYEGTIRFGTGNNNGVNTICGSIRVDDGQWHHIAVTRQNSNGQLRIFVDGQLDVQGSGPSGDLSYPNGYSGAANDPYLVIGAEKHDYDASEFPSYNGLIDELRISNSIRYSSNFTPPSSPFSTDGNTMALYHFDEGPAGLCSTGKTIVDSSGASGGPSNGTCRFGDPPNPQGPVYTTDTPFGGSPPATDTPVPAPEATPAITNVAASPLDTTATIRWNTNEPATSRVTYGSSTLDMTTTETTGYVTEHSVLLTGLNPDTPYVYQVHSKDADENSATSAEANFTTLAVDEVSHVYLPLVLK